uniref:Putative serine-threonine/tyrosine-protein kinase catalytic domain-containing protein n=1 Tax=Helianthus annuus TaxID=4232 RepID=A0A251SBJ9_HELAN
MDTFLQQFQHLKIQLEEIASATNNFHNENYIGGGGFGKVYKGEMSHSKGRTMVAIKRLDRRHGQGIPEFLKEITALSRYSHENLISLLGFCYQGDEMILVYDYASRGSLDRYLNSPHLTWLQRLKICLDAAEGLSYLHDPREAHQRLIHCDVKSANILLTEQWNGKLADFGLSIMGPANEQQSLIVTVAAALCGRLCCTYSNGRVQQNLVRTWIESYEEKKLNDIIFKDTAIEPLEQSALETFSDIAYRCLKESREDRPRMAEVVIELATALGYQKAFLQQLQLLKIPLVEITSATNHFDDEKNYIGGGAFGKIYEGELCDSKGRSMVAIKRLDPKYGQGIPEFWKEIMTLLSYNNGRVQQNLESREDRPKMAEVVKELETALRYQKAFSQQLQLLKITLIEITSATNHFDDKNYIGSGAFGKIYEGELCDSKGRSMVAIKRLDPKHGQGIPKFWKEITTLFSYKHENLISLLGHCCEGSEMILVYEHASHGSLDRHLNSPLLTWSQRLRICLDAAKGLSYLHDPGETHQRLIHCDVKSPNILLDEHWNAKVSDFGLSITGPANEQHSVAAGTPGYCDPQYAMTHTLTKESDVYSFGVVLFEVLCGRLCCTYSNGRLQQNLVRTWIESYEEKKLNDIIFKDPTIQPLEQSTLEIFSDIAYQCLKESREDRPKMSAVVAELERSLDLLNCQEFIGEWNKQFPLNYRSEVELKKFRSKGVLLNGGKTWFSLNKKGEHCEMITIAECLGSDVKSNNFSTEYNSRFAMGNYRFESYWRFKADVKTQFLSPGITYAVYLVFKFYRGGKRRCETISLKYRLQGERESSVSYLAYEREDDGWWACELYHFTCDHRIVDLQIMFEGFDNLSDILVQGIEFQPLENAENTNEKQPISDSDSDSDSDANWEEKLPTDYKDIMKWSKKGIFDYLPWTEKKKKKAYSILCKGFFLTNYGMTWFSLDKNGKKCHMLSAARMWNWKENLLLSESRFGKVIQWGDNSSIHIETEVQSQLVSSETTYGCYLVYKLPEDQSGFKAPVKVKHKQCETEDNIWYIYLTSPQTPVIRPKVIRPKAGQNTHNPLDRPKFKGLPQQRNDGWIEVQILELRVAITINMDIFFELCDKKKFSGLIIEGIEFRPI